MGVSFARRSLLVLPAALLLCLGTARAAEPAEPLAPASPEATALADLESRAGTAKIADQCVLLTQLAQGLADLAGHQLAAGHTDEATATVQKLNALTERIHVALNAKPKHLQDAEMALHNSARRLSDIVRVTSDNSANDLHNTLTHLNQVHSEMLNELFRH